MSGDDVFESLEEAELVSLPEEEIHQVDGGWGVFGPGEYDIWEAQK